MTVYNPHLQSRQELLATFVARQPLLDELVDDLRRGGKQHHLLIGDRGAGKTTLLLRLAAAIEDDKKLGRKCVALRFPEEQYNVARLSDFWLNALDALIDALSQRGERNQVRVLEAKIEALEAKDEATRTEQAIKTLQAWAKRHKRLIVLLVDNLSLVLDRLANDHWALRESLSSDNGLVMIGASAMFLHEAADYQSPFYDFFNIHELGPLSEVEAERVVRSLAQRAGTPHVAKVLDEDPGRFKALYTLTGGTPRTLALLAGVLALDHRGGIEGDLDRLLDQLTPYYKARFDDLPAQSQVVVNAVALHWHPITAAACQTATRIDLNTVSAQLNRLVKSGVLAKVALPEPSKLGFQIRERFFNIWYMMRTSRRLRRKLVWFVEFLRIFYGEEALRQRAEQLIHDTPTEKLDTAAKFLAFASAVTDPSLRRQLEYRAVEKLVNEGLPALYEQLDLEGEDQHLGPVVDRVRVLRGIRAQLRAARIVLPRKYTTAALAELIMEDPVLPLAAKQVLAKAIILGRWKKAIKLLSRKNTIPPGKQLLQSIARGELPSLMDIQTTDELKQILAQSSQRFRALSLLFGINRILDSSRILDKDLSSIIHSDTSLIFYTFSILSAVVQHGNWPQIRPLTHALLERLTAEEMRPAFAFLQTCAERGLTTQVEELLQQVRPASADSSLPKILHVAITNDEASLDALAPEMRALVAAGSPRREGAKRVTQKRTASRPKHW